MHSMMIAMDLRSVKTTIQLEFVEFISRNTLEYFRMEFLEVF